jgi:hypothetical protein
MKTMAEVLAEHAIRWVLTADPDHDERMPHVGKYLPECPTCGPVDGNVPQSTHQSEMLEAAGFGRVSNP